MSTEPTTRPTQVSWLAFDPGVESDTLVEFLCTNRWPFHVNPAPSEELVRAWIASGRFGNTPDVRGFWGRIGNDTVAFVALQDLEDPTPVFDLRIAEAWRRRGIGRFALRFIATWVFDDADKRRVEAHTRADNHSMRGLLRAEGWVQEAHHREAWPGAAGGWHDATTYCLLRRDYRDGVVTPRPALDD